MAFKDLHLIGEMFAELGGSWAQQMQAHATKVTHAQAQKQERANERYRYDPEYRERRRAVARECMRRARANPSKADIERKRARELREQLRVSPKPKERVCCEPGCFKPHHAAGKCRKHWDRERTERHGKRRAA